MFGLGTISALGISIYALLAFGLSMALMASISPDVYPPTVELAHFMMLVIVVPAVSVLAGRLSRIRRRLGEQKQELTVALEQIQLMAAHDDLTGLLNRRHMVVLLEQETQRSQRSGQGFCLALIDMDHFKRVNDRYGHAAGDEVLRAFSDTARAATDMQMAGPAQAMDMPIAIPPPIITATLPCAVASVTRPPTRMATPESMRRP